VHPTFAALTLNPSPRAGEGLSIRFPFSRSGRRGWGMRANLQNWDVLVPLRHWKPFCSRAFTSGIKKKSWFWKLDSAEFLRNRITTSAFHLNKSQPPTWKYSLFKHNHSSLTRYTSLKQKIEHWMPIKKVIEFSRLVIEGCNPLFNYLKSILSQYWCELGLSPCFLHFSLSEKKRIDIQESLLFRPFAFSTGTKAINNWRHSQLIQRNQPPREIDYKPNRPRSTLISQPCYELLL
jgi:hypothetical protein